MKKLYPLLSVLFLICWGCESSVDIDTLNQRGDKYYEINSEKPFSGLVIKNYESGQNKLKGYLKDGERDRIWTEWYENGQKDSEITYKDGKFDGLEIGWYEDGKKSYECNWKDEELDGLWTEWYKNGQKKSETNYNDGKLISKKEWNEDGSVKE